MFAQRISVYLGFHRNRAELAKKIKFQVSEMLQNNKMKATIVSKQHHARRKFAELLFL